MTRKIHLNMELCVRIFEHIWNELKAEEDEIATDKVLIFQIEKKRG